MTDSEGVTKYRLDYTPGDLPAATDLDALFRWFRRCRELELIGRDPARYAGLAYGNISQRARHGFVISGTQTGGKPALSPGDLAWVTDFDAAGNWLRATGPARPSSEAMTHGQVYRLIAAASAVIHVHSPLIWHAAQRLQLPTTAAEAAYGTPEMAAEMERLLRKRPDQNRGLFAMGGHEDGVVAYGEDLEHAGQLLLAALDRARPTAAGPVKQRIPE